jgi:hypothetical protein
MSKPKTFLTEKEYQNKRETARRRLRELAHADHTYGFAAPEDCSAWEWIRTMIMALEAGLRSQDWNHIYDVQIWLEEYHKTLPHEETMP